jgi:hypothetical protein
MSLPQWSRRSDDGGARPSVQFLIAELERGMMGRGGNHMNITGMNLGIVRTLLNHINKLEDRLDELEGRIGATVPATCGVQANILDTHPL